MPVIYKKNPISRKKLVWFVLMLAIIIVVAMVVNLIHGPKINSPVTKLLPEVTANPQVKEQPVAKSEVDQHVVESDKPRYFSLPALGINKARILSVGQDPKTYEIGTPASIYDVGWFNQSGLPGRNDKVIILDGHNGGPTKDGIFRNLPKLTTNDRFTIERGDGQIFTYQVVENYNLRLDDYNVTEMNKLLTRINNQETVTVITCVGKWIKERQTYDKRNIIRAVLVKSTPHS